MVLPDALHQFALVLILHEHQISPVECPIQIERGQAVTGAAQVRIGGVNLLDRRRATFRQQVLHTAAILRFINLDIMST